MSDIAKTMVRALFLAGHRIVILDATNTTEERRAEWQGFADRIYYKCFKISAGTCIERAKMVGREDLVPVIERMAETLTFPEEDAQPPTSVPAL